MNGIAFVNVPRLVYADFTGNVCVDKLFLTQPSAKVFRRVISRSCALTKNEISCRILPFCMDTDLFNRTLSCCEVEYGTYVDSPDYSFDAKEGYNNIEVIRIEYQGNIEFLPVSVHATFSSLKVYSVSHVPVQMITKKNFEKLFKLEKLLLHDNQIEMIRSNTFDDLISLRVVQISKKFVFYCRTFCYFLFFECTGMQRLISLNWNAFANLARLEIIDLSINYCISREFNGEQIKTLAPESISNNCGFDEIDSAEVPCERFETSLVEVCFMNERTSINSTKFVVAELRNDEMQGIIFTNNTKIEYLPYKIHLQFPNLIYYYADKCSIKQISKENFESLNRLERIDLSFNRIQKISGNTFQGLGKLQKFRFSRFSIFVFSSFY